MEQGLVSFLELDADPYDPEEEDPAKSQALESSLWELQVSTVGRHSPCCAPALPEPGPVSGVGRVTPRSPHASQALQRHYHPEVSQAASVINQALSVPEVSIAPLLELTAFDVRAGGTLGPGWLGCRDLAVQACHLPVPCRCSSGT